MKKTESLHDYLMFSYFCFTSDEKKTNYKLSKLCSETIKRIVIGLSRGEEKEERAGGMVSSPDEKSSNESGFDSEEDN